MSSIKAEGHNSSGSRQWSRVFAGLYDPVLWVGERAGMSRRRSNLLALARGRTLEIGSGTGLNLPYYPDHLDELILAEPDASMRKHLEQRLRRKGSDARLLDAPAERLPVADGSIDTVVATLVLCTVDSPDLALDEIVRVLHPDGQLLFIEHVRSQAPWLASLQDRLVRPWQSFAVGCRCNRETARLMADAGLKLEAREEPWQAMVPIVRPLIAGRATVRR